MYQIEPLQQTHSAVSYSAEMSTRSVLEGRLICAYLTNMCFSITCPAILLISGNVFFQETAARPHRVRRTASFNWNRDPEEDCKEFQH